MSSVDLNEVAEIILGQNFGICAAATLIYYDWLVSFPQEVHLIWHSKWTPGKVLFLVIRYLGLLDAAIYLYVQFGTSVSTMSCDVTMYWTLSTSALVYILSALVIALRTYAIWNKNFYLAIGLAVAWLTLTVAAIVFAIYSMIGLTPYAQLPGLPGCGPRSTDASAAASVKVYAFNCAYEGVIFLLTIGRGLQHLSKPSGLMLVLYRDAFLASTCLLTFSMMNTILSSTSSPTFYCAYMLSFAFSFIVPCRIILNLRATTAKLDDWDVATGDMGANEKLPLSGRPLSGSPSSKGKAALSPVRDSFPRPSNVSSASTLWPTIWEDEREDERDVADDRTIVQGEAV